MTNTYHVGIDRDVLEGDPDGGLGGDRAGLIKVDHVKVVRRHHPVWAGGKNASFVSRRHFFTTHTHNNTRGVQQSANRLPTRQLCNCQECSGLGQSTSTVAILAIDI